MESVSRFFLRALCLFLAFLLGFLCCVGAIVGAGFYVYGKVSFDTINDKFTHLDTDGLINREEADVLITSLSIKELIAEYKALVDLGDELTVQYLLDRYGVIVSDEVNAFLTDDIRAISVNKLWTKEGLDSIMQTVSIGTLLKFEKVANPDYDPTDPESEEFIWVDSNDNTVTGIEAFAADFNLYDIINGNISFDSITEELKIGDVLNLDPVVLPAYAKNENGDLVPVEGIDNLTVWYQSNGTAASSILGVFAGSSIADISSSFDSIVISDVIGCVSVAYTDEDGEERHRLYNKNITSMEDGTPYVLLTEEKNGLTTEFGGMSVGDFTGDGINDTINKIELIDVLGYEERGGVWYDKSGNKAESYMVALLHTPEGDPTTINNIADSIGGIQVGSFAGYSYDEELGIWLDEDGEEADGIIATLADLTVEDMTDNGKLTDKIQTIELATVLGYEYDEVTNKWYEKFVAPGSAENVEVSQFMEALIVDSEGNLTTVESVSGTIDELQVGKLAGYEKHGEVWYEIYDEENPENSVPASGILATISDLTVKDMSDNDTLTEEIQSVTLVDVLGYEYDEASDKWYEKFVAPDSPENVEVSSFMAALIVKNDGELTKVNEVASTVDEMTVAKLTGYEYDEVGGKWINEDGEEAEGVLSALIDLTVKDLSDGDKLSDEINDVELSVILGYEKHGNVWYETYIEDGHADNVEAGKLMAALFESDGEPVKIGGVSQRIESMSVGEFAGFTYDEENDIWLDEDGEQARGVLASLADLKVTEMSDESKLTEKIKHVELGYAMGYYLHEYVNGDGDTVKEWYTDSTMTAKPDGIMGAICDTPVGEIQDRIDETAIGELLGYEKSGDVWLDENDEQPSNVISAIADLKFSELNDNKKLTEAIEVLTVADAMGYTYDEVEQKYYKDGQPMTGVMAVVAGTPIKDMQDKINNSDTGELMGYVAKEVPVLDGEGNPTYDGDGNAVVKIVWYDGEDEVHPLMNKVANTKFDELDTLPNTMTLVDIIPEDKRQSGLISLIKNPEEVTIDGIPEAMNDVFNDTTLYDLADKDVITFKPIVDGNGDVIKTAAERKEEFKQKSFATWKMSELLEFLLDVPDSFFGTP